MRSTLIASSLLAAMAIASRAEASPNYAVLGEGTQSCGTWTAQHASYAGGADTAEGLMENGWLAGFITATNVSLWAKLPTGSSTVVDLSPYTDFEGLKGYVSNYCKDHPLEQIATAAIYLVTDLMAKQNGVK